MNAEVSREEMKEGTKRKKRAVEEKEHGRKEERIGLRKGKKAGSPPG